ncbi:hypothetical protein NDU88_001030 [Pleurodeles waltl]|uniref:Uncharacterized protein n=1 Tax=Pleurodeles waltl TaxID=8319 RepID=A0AAV7P5Y0_PLEWA|nr:hypothetical protein NDU88_001030 [Pleurodeles waltl]
MGRFPSLLKPLIFHVKRADRKCLSGSTATQCGLTLAAASRIPAELRIQNSGTGFSIYRFIETKLRSVKTKAAWGVSAEEWEPGEDILTPRDDAGKSLTHWKKARALRRSGRRCIKFSVMRLALQQIFTQEVRLRCSGRLCSDFLVTMQTSHQFWQLVRRFSMHMEFPDEMKSF